MNLLIRTLIVCICILFYVSYLHGQANYYTAAGAFNESGYTYQCDIPSYNLVILYNKSNSSTAKVDEVRT